MCLQVVQAACRTLADLARHSPKVTTLHLPLARPVQSSVDLKSSCFLFGGTAQGSALCVTTLQAGASLARLAAGYVDRLAGPHPWALDNSQVS